MERRKIMLVSWLVLLSSFVLCVCPRSTLALTKRLPSLLKMAGFEVTLRGRFWVTPDKFALGLFLLLLVVMLGVFTF